MTFQIPSCPTFLYDPMTFFRVIQEEALAVCNTFTCEEGQNMPLSIILSKFEKYCMPKKIRPLKDTEFFICKQKRDSIYQYVPELKRLSKNSACGNLLDSLIKDRIMRSIAGTELPKILLCEGDISLEKTVQMYRGQKS